MSFVRLLQAYLEDFYRFCKVLGGTTAESMCELLAFEADRRAFIITINSFGTELTKDDRAMLYPKCGKLFPYGLAALARCDDYEQVILTYAVLRKQLTSASVNFGLILLNFNINHLIFYWCEVVS